MQAEDIIQQKEWAELTTAEREVIAELAEDEASFNLLKKMLLVVSEDEMPVMDARIHENLLQAMETRKAPVIRFRNMFYAAAAIVLVCFAVWFVIRDKNIDPGTAGVDPKNNPPTEQVAKKNDSTTLAPVIVATTPTTSPVKKHHKKETAPKEPTEDLAVNATVEQNTILLAFISEVY